jgi:hypothetical protein
LVNLALSDSQVWQTTRLYIRAVLRVLGYSFALLTLLFLLQRSTYPLGLDWNFVSAIVRSHQFDYVTWEINALATKTGQFLWGVHPFMDEESRSQFVRDYMVDLERARQLEAQIEVIFIDPAVDDPESASAALRAERDDLRTDLSRRQPLMESILEGQVAAVLVDEGFGVLGQLLPPISMHFTQVPNLLIASPRDRIEFQISINLDPLPLEQIVALEERIEQERDLSTLVVPLGGIALYPAMILETTNLPWAVETFAHEWSHHYLFFYPLGLQYDFSGETRIINETVADLFGKEVAQLALARYYPELVAPLQANAQTVPVIHTEQEAAFNFGAEMHQTRTTVDTIMAEVQVIQEKASYFREIGEDTLATSYEEWAQNVIVKAEDYMEARRMVFHENGYRIRRLNQAYFAFYGGYQAGIPGIGGEDPIGPAVQDIRNMSPDILSFIVTMRDITTRDQLLAVRDAMRAETASSTE